MDLRYIQTFLGMCAIEECERGHRFGLFGNQFGWLGNQLVKKDHPFAKEDNRLAKKGKRFAEGSNEPGLFDKPFVNRGNPVAKGHKLFFGLFYFTAQLSDIQHNYDNMNVICVT